MPPPAELPVPPEPPAPADTPRPDPTEKPAEGVASDLPPALTSPEAPPRDPAPPARKPGSGAAGKSRQNKPLNVKPAPSKEDPATLPHLTPVPEHSPSTEDLLADPAAAPIDPDLKKVQVPDSAALPLGGRPGQPLGEPAPAAAPGGGEGLMIVPPDRLPIGRQAVALTVEVFGPKTINLNRETTLRIVVKNTGTTDAMNVVVRDQFPDGLAFISSQPVEHKVTESLFIWNLNLVPAGAEKIINVKVRPTKVGQLDHAATVTMVAGSKSRTLVQEPKLKVEQVATSGQVLIGRQVEFKIALTNSGDGYARKVIVRAKLSAGLRAATNESNDQNIFEQEFDVIKPNERIELEPLVADTVAGGAQTCEVEVTTPDVVGKQEGLKDVKTVSVIEPKLQMEFTGPAERYTESDAEYLITLHNPGTAAARNVKLAVTLPISGGQLLSLPANARYDKSTRRIQWTTNALEPGEKEKVAFKFQMRVNGPGMFTIVAETRADGALADKKRISTNVVGMADLVLNVSTRKRLVDAGAKATYEIRIQNLGTKEASRVLVRAELSDNLEALETDHDAKTDPKTKSHIQFAVIEHLPAGHEKILRIKVTALKAGQATCHVFLTHDDLGDGKNDRIEDIASSSVIEPRRQ
jgi:uncharacterized repeat protein (TIGR01451 family)